MACRREFWINSVRGLHMIKKHFEEFYGKDFSEFRRMIFGSIDFETCNHRGPLKPMYYHQGLPSDVWVCKTCTENAL